MPWCEACSRYLTPNTVREDGTCPDCGDQVEAAAQQNAETLADEKAPWHFKLMVVAVIAYLVWRLVDLFS
jgi:hypothetical protein